MVETIFKKPIEVKQTKVNFSIKSGKLDNECNAILDKLSKGGWNVYRNCTQDVICISLSKDKVSSDDVKLFDKLAQYVDDNSSMQLMPVPFNPNSPSIWWFFERGKMRESHWGVNI